MPEKAPGVDTDWPTLEESVGRLVDRRETGISTDKSVFTPVSCRVSSECSDDQEEMFIFPLSLTDIGTTEAHLSNVSPPSSPQSLPISPRIRRHNVQRTFSQPVVHRWRRIVRRVMSLEDPWDKFNITGYDTEVAKRYRYSAVTQRWVTDTVEVKMQTEPFARGAMRQCYRLKKLGNHQTGKTDLDWKHTLNYVAKRYISEVERETYFEDVRLQMDAKLWGEEFNRHNPPKKVDIFQMAILEFEDRSDKPLYHLEHYIEGNYIKYNSNSGFVSETIRKTPHAFSHFTFERSGHQLIVVDVQGVGDLYTDPQIHTADGRGYGDGNLGTKGMALFFHSHLCNDICDSLELSSFDLAPAEIAQVKKMVVPQRKMTTVCRASVLSCSSSRGSDAESVMDFIRQRSTLSVCSDHSDEGYSYDMPPDPARCSISGVRFSLINDELDELAEEQRDDDGDAGGASYDPMDRRSYSQASNHVPDSGLSSPSDRGGGLHVNHGMRRSSELSTGEIRSSMEDDYDELHSCSAGGIARKAHNNYQSVGFNFDNLETPRDRSRASFDSFTCSKPSNRPRADDTIGDKEEEKEAFWNEMRMRSRPSTVFSPEDLRAANANDEEIHMNAGIAKAILGQIHLDMARYHELGRFIRDMSIMKHLSSDGTSDVLPPQDDDDSDEGCADTAPVVPLANYDRHSAWYHLDLAISCNNLEAIRTAADIYLGREHTLLGDLHMEDEEDSINRGLDLMEKAAELGDRAAMVFLAQAYDTGYGLGTERKRNWSAAARWYEKGLIALDETVNSESGEFGSSENYDASLDNPKYAVLARLAEMYRAGGYGLQKDANRSGDLYNEAAEAAMEAMKGKLATKYYMLAEEVYGEAEEDEEEACEE